MSSDSARPRRGWWLRSRAWLAILVLTPFTIGTLCSDPLIADESRWGLPLHAFAWAFFFSGVAWRWWATLYVGGRKERIIEVVAHFRLEAWWPHWWTLP